MIRKTKTNTYYIMYNQQFSNHINKMNNVNNNKCDFQKLVRYNNIIVINFVINTLGTPKPQLDVIPVIWQTIRLEFMCWPEIRRVIVQPKIIEFKWFCVSEIWVGKSHCSQTNGCNTWP